MKKPKWMIYAGCIVGTLLLGFLSSFFVSAGMDYKILQKPPLSPPGAVFPIAWSILYILMGISLALVLLAPGGRDKSAALKIYAVQLAVNLLWPFFFFTLGWYFFSFLWLCLLWVLILATILSFQKISPRAAWLLVPYLLWVTFAGYLNLGIALLNKF